LKVKSSDDAVLLLNYTNDHNTFYFVTAPCNTLTSQVTYPTGSNPYSVVAADVNGDGKPDIVVANSYSNDTGVLLNTGHGTFAAEVTTITGSNPYSVAAADVNGDGNLDIIVANRVGNNVGVLINKCN
jgi:hypothetical protein